MSQNPPDKLIFPFRVRYAECDPQNVAHHSAYVVWMEAARTELLRRQGVAYRDLESRGVFFVVARLNVRYRRPARYDDELALHVWVSSGPDSRIKIEHAYELYRGEELLAAADTTLVCVDDEGRVRPVPDECMAGR